MMKILVLDQNEVKSYIIPVAGILYVVKELILSRNTGNIRFYFSGGQNITLSFSSTSVDEVYTNIQEQLKSTE